MVLLASLAVLIWTAALSVIDLRERRLPNLLTLTGNYAGTTAGQMAEYNWGKFK